MALAAGAWSETALVTITKYAASGGTDVNFHAITETIDIDMGDKDIEQLVAVGGGRLIKKVPQEITTITFEGYPVDINSASGSGVSQMFEGGTWDTTQPLTADSSRLRDLFRVAILWTDDTSVTSATAATGSTTNSYRITFAHCWMTSMKPSFTDGVLKFTFSFKVAPFNRFGISQIHEESADSASLPALNIYNQTNYDPNKTSAFTW